MDYASYIARLVGHSASHRINRIQGDVSSLAPREDLKDERDLRQATFVTQ
jgi:hypothetical protein